jgi:hypothetical protein
MGSINAQMVAQKVSGNIRRGKKVVLAEIIKEVGYSDSVADRPSLVTSTKSYQVALNLDRKPILEGLQLQINKAKEALEKKDLNKEDVRTLVGTIDILIKNYQLLSGGATTREVFVLPSEVMERNRIQSTENVNKVNGLVEPQIE